MLPNQHLQLTKARYLRPTAALYLRLSWPRGVGRAAPLQLKCGPLGARPLRYFTYIEPLDGKRASFHLPLL